MRRIMIQADEALLDRARRRAADRGVSVAQVVRDALERDLGEEPAPPPAASVGIIESELGITGRQTADDDAYMPDEWR